MIAKGPLERHFSVRTIAELLSLDETTITRRFQNEPGVVKLKNDNGGKRAHTTLRIPESVLLRVYGDLIRE